MAKFHGPTNLHLGSEPVWAAAEYDPESHDYVVEVTGADLKKFRAVADEYGFVEDGKADAEADDKGDQDA